MTRVATVLVVLALAAVVPGWAAESVVLGDEVILEGVNSETDTTYLFMTGPNIPAEGGRLDSPQTAVIDGDPDSFTRTGVEADGGWRYRWQTRGIGLDAGVYVVYAESQPRSRTNLVQGEYSTQSYSFGRSSRTTTIIPTATTTVMTPPTILPGATSPVQTLATAAPSPTRSPGFSILAAVGAFSAAIILLRRHA